MEVAFWRATLAWLFFSTHAVLTRSIGIKTRDIPMVVLFALAGITLFYSVYQLAIQAGGAAMASVLLYTAPAWVTVMARFAFKETLSPIKLTALGLTLVGVICVASGGGSVDISLPAICYGLAAGFTYSLYYIFGKHFSTRTHPPTFSSTCCPSGRPPLFPGSSLPQRAHRMDGTDLHRPVVDVWRLFFLLPGPQIPGSVPGGHHGHP